MQAAAGPVGPVLVVDDLIPSLIPRPGALHPDQRPATRRARRRLRLLVHPVTNLDVTTPDRAAAVEHWYRHRTQVENVFRDTKHGAALRHLPEDIPRSTGHGWGARCSPPASPAGCTNSPPAPPPTAACSDMASATA